MVTSTPYDVAAPWLAGLVVGAGGCTLIVLTLIISTIESLVMVLLKWDRFARSLWASLFMNIISAIFGMVFGLVALAFPDVSLIKRWYTLLAIAFVLSVLIEGGVLMLMKRGAVRQNWIVSLTANLSSYMFIILPFFVLLLYVSD